MSGKKIVVIGAGLAGLTAAFYLKKANFDVSVYEARPRVGGRILTVNLAGHLSELGAQNLADGGDFPHIKKLLQVFGLSITQSRLSLSHAYFDEENLHTISELLKNRAFDPLTLKEQLLHLKDSCRNMEEVVGSLIEPDDPLKPFVAARLAAYEGASLDKLSTVYCETLLHILLGGVCAVHPSEENSMELAWVEGGNSLLVQKMGEWLGDQLHLDRPLKKIAKTKGGRFSLDFEKGVTVKADCVVLAIPASVYQAISFENTIPDERLSQIKSVDYGTNAKIQVPFPFPPTIRHGVITDHTVCFFADPSVLTIYCTGESSCFSQDTLSENYKKVWPVIERSFDHCPSFILPTYAGEEPCYFYAGPVGYSWTEEAYSKGSYSYIAAGKENLMSELSSFRGENFKKLFAPIDNLYFAGEHTSILSDIPGTMEAACESGERVARTILKNLL